MSTLQSKIGLGTVQFGTDYGISNLQGKTSNEEVGNILEYALKSDITYLDTAYAYGDAETVLGNFDLKPYKIISKYIPNDISLTEQFHKSLLRLGVDSFYGYLAHRPLDLIEDGKKNWNILKEFQSGGKVKKIGASFNSKEELDALLDSGIELDIIQVPFNYFDHRFEYDMKKLKDQGVEIHTRSAFLQGLFFCDPDILDDFFNDIKVHLKELQKAEDLAGKLLKFVLEKPFVDVVNIGVNNLAQLEENLMQIRKVSEELPKITNQFDSRILMPSEWPK